MKPRPNEHPAVAIRALYTDLDGTLLGPRGSLLAREDGGVTTAASDAVASLHRAGVSIVPVSGRTVPQMREAARILGADSFLAEMGAFVVVRGPGGEKQEIRENFGALAGRRSPFDSMTRSGAASFLLERYAGRLEPHTPWSFERREATVMLRGLVDTAEVARALSDSGYGALELLDNGRLARTYGSLEAPEARLYHLVPRGVGKASGLRLHRKLSGLPLTETAAVGDSISDLDMASEVGTFFLVGGRSRAAALETGRVPNARRTEKAAGEGFAEAVASLLAEEILRDT